MKKKIKYFICSLLVLITLGNQWTETNVQQFLKDRPHHKPPYREALNEIQKSKYKNYAINMDFADINQDQFNLAIDNYFKQLIKTEKFEISSIDIKNIKNGDPFWFLCLSDINKSFCDYVSKKKEFKVLEEKNFQSVDLKLVKFLKNNES